MKPITAILIGVFTLLALAYGIHSIVYRRDRGDKKRVLFHAGFVLATILLGLAFIGHYPYNRYGFLQIMIYLWCAYSGFVLAYYFKALGQQRVIFAGFALFYLFFILLKFILFDNRNFYLRTPLNVCNLVLVFIVLRPFVKNRMLDNYSLTLGVLGAIMNFFLGAWHNDSYNNTSVYIPGDLGFYYIEVIEATLVHAFFLSFCAYAFMTKAIIPRVREMMKNFIWIVPLFIVLIFTNQIYEGDFFFTGVLRETPPPLIALYYSLPGIFTVTLGGRVFEINILDNLIVLAGSFGILSLATFALVRLDKAVKR